jgi:hypothetical protein
MTRRPLNPFQVSRLPTAEEFCDREREVARFRQAWAEPGAKLVAYGDRRLGKSAVLDRAAEESRAAGRTVVVFSVATALGPEDAVQRLIRAVHAAIGRSWKTLVQDLAGALRLSVTMAPAPDGTSVPEFSLGLEPRGAQSSAALLTDALDAIEAQLQRRRIHLGLGIDEFQRLLAWGGEDIEWQLKAALEKHRRLSYVLTGSSTSLIEEMVSTKGRALWKAVETMRIGPIPAPELQRWIVERSRLSGLPLASETAARITALAGPRTRDVIVLARATWEDARARDDGGDPERALLVHLAETGDLHARIWEQRTERERRILRMLATNPTVEPTAEGVRHHYRLGASSTVTKAIGVLVHDEVLARDGTGVVFDDPFFRAWVRQSTGGDVRPPGA